MGNFFTILVFLIGCLVYSQETKESFITKNKNLEVVKSYNPNYKVSIKDTRSLELNKIPMESLDNNLRGFHELFEKIVINEELSQLKNKEIKIHIDFFNFIASSTKNTILKGMASIEIIGGDYSSVNMCFTLSDEDFTSFKFKNITKAKYHDKLTSLIEKFSKKYAKKIVSKINNLIKNETHFIYEITSIGTAKINDKMDKELALKSAKLNALIRASEAAFGMQIINTSKIEDYGDVSDIVESKTGATVLKNKIVDNTISYTTDNYCCVVIKSIIKKKT